MKQFALCVFAALFLTACGKGSGSAPSAETSVKIDIDEQKDALEKNLEKAGREIKAGAKEAQEKLEDAGDAIKDKLEDAKDKLDNDKKTKIEIEIKKD